MGRITKIGQFPYWISSGIQDCPVRHSQQADYYWVALSPDEPSSWHVEIRLLWQSATWHSKFDNFSSVAIGLWWSRWEHWPYLSYSRYSPQDLNRTTPYRWIEKEEYLRSSWPWQYGDARRLGIALKWLRLRFRWPWYRSLVYEPISLQTAVPISSLGLKKNPSGRDVINLDLIGVTDQPKYLMDCTESSRSKQPYDLERRFAAGDIRWGVVLGHRDCNEPWNEEEMVMRISSFSSGLRFGHLQHFLVLADPPDLYMLQKIFTEFELLYYALHRNYCI